MKLAAHFLLLWSTNIAWSQAPNVVLIVTDDQGYGDLACHGNPILETPNLDRLHRQSVRLTNFHVSPTCSPTRAALMTGRHNDRVGVWHTINGRSLLPAAEVTLAEVFKASRYATGMFGKWHLGDNYPLRPEDQGFDRVVRHAGGGVGQRPDYPGNNYFDAHYCSNGQWQPYEGFCTDVWFSCAHEFIRDNRSRPFFAYISTNAPHSPYKSPEPELAKYRDFADQYRHKPSVGAFYGMIDNIDQNVGRTMRLLDELGIAQDTILIFMTDNGSAQGGAGGKLYNAGMRGIKGSPYEGGHRVPCMIRWPRGKIHGGKDVHQLTAHIDLFPTLVELCQLNQPQGPMLDGVSLARLLLLDHQAWPQRTLVVDSQRLERLQKYRRASVMTQQWRLVSDGGGTSPRWKLFDIQSDPGQTTNVVNEYPEVTKQLQDSYEQWWAELQEEQGDYTRICIGSDEEPVTQLNWHDWHPTSPSNENPSQAGINGWWAIDVAKAGRYRIALRMGHRVEERPLNATQALLRVGDHEVAKTPDPNQVSVEFEVDMPSGPTRLQSWLGQDEGSPGAQWVYVSRL